MATQRIVGGYGTTESQGFYDKLLLLRAVPRMVHGQYGRKGTIPAKGGVTISFRRFETIAASTTALTEGTPPSETNPSITLITTTISQYGERLLAVLKSIKFREHPLWTILSQVLKRKGATTKQWKLKQCLG